MKLETMVCETGEGQGHIVLNRPERGNGLTPELIRELAETVERLDLDPEVRVIVLSGNGSGFCGGYDLVASAEKMLEGEFGSEDAPAGSPLDPMVQAANHDPSKTWDPMVDYAGMSRNVRAFMSLFHCTKPVICKVHGFCVAGAAAAHLLVGGIRGDPALVADGGGVDAVELPEDPLRAPEAAHRKVGDFDSVGERMS